MCVNVEDRDGLPSSVRNLALHQDLHPANQDENLPTGRATYSRCLPYPSRTTQLPSRRSAASVSSNL